MKNVGTVFLVFFISVLGLISIVINFEIVTSGLIDIRGVEPNVVYSIESTILGKSLYQNPVNIPYSVTQYSPLFYILSAKFSQILGFHPGSQYMNILTLARSVSFFSLLALSTLFFFAAKRVGAKNISAYLGSILVINVTIPWFSLARPDALCAFFGIAGLIAIIFALTEKKEETKKIIIYSTISGACCWLSLISKQNGVVAIVVCSIISVLIDRKRLSAGFFSGLTLSVLVTALIASFYFSVSWGDILNAYRNIFDGVQNGINVELAYTKTYNLALTTYSIFLIFPLACSLILLKGKVGCHLNDPSLSPHLKCLSIAFIVNLVFGLLTALKNGSAIHYMNEPMIIGILLATAVLNSRLNNTNFYKDNFLNFVAFVFTIFFLASNLYAQARSYSDALSAPRNSISDPILLDTLRDELTKYNDSYFSVERGSRISTLLFPERVVTPQPDITGVFKHTPEVLNGKLHLIKSGALRYILNNVNETVNTDAKSFIKLYRGIQQEILVNTCAKTTKESSPSKVYTAEEFQNLSIRYVDRHYEEGRWFVALRITNMNHFPISAVSETGKTIRLSWKFSDASSSEVSTNWDTRVDLPCDVDSNEPLEVLVPVEENLEKRKFLQFDLVQEGVFWMHDLGTPPLSIPWN